MRFSTLVLSAGLAIATTSGGALAQSKPTVGGEAVGACLDRQISVNAPAAQCVNAAHQPCLEDGQEAPAAAVQCFIRAKEDWADLLAEQLTRLQPDLDETEYASLEIHTRYDVLANLVQCDRMHELTLLQTLEGTAIALQKARCEATAAGLVYMKLLWQARQMAEAQQ